MKYVSHYECTQCLRTFDKTASHLTCPQCADKGILDIIYDYDKLKTFINHEYFAAQKTKTIARYLPLLSIEGTGLDRCLNVGNTPLYEANQLTSHLRIKQLFIKDDGLNPSGSLKDRASLIACMKALEANYDTIACASTGNAASSLAAQAARVGLKTMIFVPKRVPKGKLAQLYSYGATIIKVDGDYKAAYALSKAAIDHFQYYNRNAAINPHMVEGKKTVAYEIAEQLNFNITDWVICSVGDGCTIAGIYKGFYDLKQLGMIERIPRLLGVQSEGCAPIYQAYISGKPLKESDENSIADSIAVGIPRNPIKALKAIEQSNGAMISVKDDDILKSGKLLSSHEGIFAEPSSAASLSGLIKAIKQGIISEKENVTLINTGNGLKDTEAYQKQMDNLKTLSNDLESLKNFLKETRDTS